MLETDKKRHLQRYWGHPLMPPVKRKGEDKKTNERVSQNLRVSNGEGSRFYISCPSTNPLSIKRLVQISATSGS
jgi:hypothetical protein